MSEVKWAVRNPGVRNLATTSDGFFEVINPLVPQGVNQNQRIGNKIQYKYLKFTYYNFIAAAANILYIPMRLLLVVPLVPMQVTSWSTFQPLVFDQVQGPTSWLSTTNPKNVRVLYDRTWIQGTDDTFAVSGIKAATRPIKVGRRIWNNVTYVNALNEIPTEPKDLVYLVITWPETTTATAITTSMFIRMSYRDL